MASTTLDTPVGPFTIIAAGSSVLAAGFTGHREDLLALVPPDVRRPTGADLEPVTAAVTAYFAGNLTAIDAIATEQHTGGEFLAHAWKVMRDIHAGESITYTEFAARAGRPAAVRAAGAACARNAVALFVPCHRVLRTDGGLGGYRWGIGVKKFLLAHEREHTNVGTTNVK